MSVLQLTVDAADASWNGPDPFPGSREARIQGCICPEFQPGWTGTSKKLLIDQDCKVHEVTEQQLN